MGRKMRPPQENPNPPACGFQNYIGFQKIINSNNGQIDEELLEKHIEFMMADQRWKWEEIVPVDFSKILPGYRVRYTTFTDKKYMFRTGGWIISVAEDFSWFVYRAHTYSNWSVNSKDCQRLWVIKTNKKTTKNTIVFKNPGPPGKFNSFLSNEHNEEIRVGSFDTQFLKNRFENSLKFKKALNGHSWSVEKINED